MQNLIRLQTVIKSDGELGSQPHDKAKNKQNYIPAHEFTFQKIKTFLTKSFSWE